MRSVFVVILLASALAGCATPPSHTRNACAIFDQRDSFFNNWRSATEHASRQYGVPVPIILATIYTESGFRHNARPPRTKLFGFIPWKRQSTAYGYSQALDGPGTATSARRAAAARGAPTMPMPCSLSAGITATAMKKRVSRSTTPTISTLPITPAWKAISGAHGAAGRKRRAAPNASRTSPTPMRGSSKAATEREMT